MHAQENRASHWRSSDTVLAHWTRALVARADLDEQALVRLATRCGVRPQALHDAHASIPDAGVRALWSELTGDAPHGTGLRFADALEPSTLGLIGYLVAASGSLIDALRRVERYQARAKAPGGLIVTLDRERVRIAEVPVSGGQPWPVALAEAVIGSYLAMGRKLSAAPLVALEVRFQHAPPERARDARAIAEWLGCTPRYHAAVNELVLARAALDRPIRTRDPRLLGYLEPIARAELDAVDSPLPRVRTLIGRALSNGERPSLAAIARTLGLAPRSLQRRLALDGSSFSALVDEVRHDTARRLLDDSRLSRAEVAHLLGYGDASALHKGLQRWGRRARD